jgi:two-component system response regulator NreC
MSARLRQFAGSIRMRVRKNIESAGGGTRSFPARKLGTQDDDFMRILVADDNAAVRRGVLDILARDRNYEVCGEAKDGADAIQKAKDLIPDLVLLDVSLPGLNGLEVARHLCQEIPGTAIVILSQHDPGVLLPRARELGARACVDKSRLGTDLLRTIASLGKIS